MLNKAVKLICDLMEEFAYLRTYVNYTSDSQSVPADEYNRTFLVTLGTASAKLSQPRTAVQEMIITLHRDKYGLQKERGETNADVLAQQEGIEIASELLTAINEHREVRGNALWEGASVTTEKLEKAVRV